MTITLTPTPQNYGVPTAAAVLAGLYCKKAMTILSRETNQKVIKPLNNQLFRSNVHVSFTTIFYSLKGAPVHLLHTKKNVWRSKASGNSNP